MIRGIVDTHAHFEDKAFDEDREEMLRSLPENGIVRVVNVGSSPDSSRRCAALAREWEHCWAAVGVHPSDTADLTEADMEELKTLCAEEKVLAVGEIGLDYHYPDPPKDHQKRWFVRQLELARETGLPVMIHSRDAAMDTYDIIRANGGQDMVMDIHCFSYSREEAARYLDMGHYLGIGGVVTFKNSKKLKEIVSWMPLNRILLETDCPYMAPTPHRGERNSSLFLPFVAAKIAELKGIDPDEVIGATAENAARFYGWS